MCLLKNKQSNGGQAYWRMVQPEPDYKWWRRLVIRREHLVRGGGANTAYREEDEDPNYTPTTDRHPSTQNSRTPARDQADDEERVSK